MQKSCIVLLAFLCTACRTNSNLNPSRTLSQGAFISICYSKFEMEIHSIALIILQEDYILITDTEFAGCLNSYSISIHSINSSDLEGYDYGKVIANLDKLGTGTLVVFAMFDVKSASIIIQSIVGAESRHESQLIYILIWPPTETETSYTFDIQKLILRIHGKGSILPLSLKSKLYFMIPQETSDFAAENTIPDDCIYFEAYLLSDNEIRINQVPVERLGNTVISRMDLRDHYITATAPMGNLTQGEIIWGESEDGTPLLKTGFGVEIFECIQDALNFKSISLPTTGWASVFPNGTWQEGMANEVLAGRADIGLAKTSILPYRANALGYLQPIHTLIVTAYFKQPEEGLLRNIFILPFEFQLWICMLMTWFLFFISVLCLHWLKKCDSSDSDNLDIELEDTEIDHLDPFVWIIASISQRGLHITPSSYSFRIVFIAGEILALVIFVAYAATLVSIFSTSNIPIKSIQDLLRSNFRLFVDENNAGARLVVSKSNLTTTNTNNLLSSRIHSGGKQSYIPASKGAEILTTQNEVAFITFSDTFYTTYKNIFGSSEKYLCDKVSSVPVTGIPFRSGVFLAKNSPYKQVFSVKMATIFTSGLMHRYVNEYERSYVPACSDDLKERKSPTLALSHVWPAFLLFGFGVLVSGIVFLYEYFINIHIRIRKPSLL